MDLDRMIGLALESKKNAYVPYSNFHVGACVYTDDERYFTGNNIEIASYSPTLCAERTAIFKAISEGAKRIMAIAVTGDSEYTFPCGVCRQVLREFAALDCKIYVVKNKSEYKEYSLEQMLPFSFGSENLGNRNV